MRSFPRQTAPAVLTLALLFAACNSDESTGANTNLQCEANNAGLTLPTGFCAVVVADLTVGGAPARARHMALTPAGDLFVAINTGPQQSQPAFGIIGLRDADGDGHAEVQTQFSAGLGGSGIAWSTGKLYFGANDRILRFTLPSGSMEPTGDAETAVTGLPNTGDHISKTVVVNGSDLYVNVGSASNSCQVQNRVDQSPGVFPCPELDTRAGVWKFSTTGTSQTQSVANRFATGYRNMVALAINPADGKLYGVQHGRDTLFGNWSQFFTAEESAELPAEEFVRLDQGSNNGWPYCYYDALTLNKKVLAPEYGGDGNIVASPAGGNGINCATYNMPLATFPAHYAPNGMLFYTGSQFPSKYRNGLFVAMHGSHNRSPLTNEGFNVMFLPLSASGGVNGSPEIFASGFAGAGNPLPANAEHRPVAFALANDGSIYVSDDKGGRIYRIIYRP